jgi:ribonuclease D
MERIRAIPKGFAASRMGRSLMEAIAAGRDTPPPDNPHADNTRRKREPSPSAIDLLKTLLRLRAEEAKVAPRLIANADDIEKLAAHEDEGVAALHGWRAEVFGNDALALRQGKLALALENGEAVIVELDD